MHAQSCAQLLVAGVDLALVLQNFRSIAIAIIALEKVLPGPGLWNRYTR